MSGGCQVQDLATDVVLLILLHPYLPAVLVVLLYPTLKTMYSRSMLALDAEEMDDLYRHFLVDDMPEVKCV